MQRINVPWYRWRFSLPMIVCIGLFAWLVYKSLTDMSAPTYLRITGAVLFGLLALVFAVLIWCKRQVQ